jgi:hypothetical protein
MSTNQNSLMVPLHLATLMSVSKISLSEDWSLMCCILMSFVIFFNLQTKKSTISHESHTQQSNTKDQMKLKISIIVNSMNSKLIAFSRVQSRTLLLDDGMAK